MAGARKHGRLPVVGVLRPSSKDVNDFFAEPFRRYIPFQHAHTDGRKEMLGCHRDGLRCRRSAHDPEIDLEKRERDREELAVHKDQEFSEVETYLKDRELRLKGLLSAIEKDGIEGALDRCRVLAEQINRDLHGERSGHFVVNISSLADFQASLEHTASLLEENTEVHRQSTEVDLVPGVPHAAPASSLQLPDPNGPTVVGSPATIPREKLFQRVWPRVMIGVIFVLEVVWIFFLVYLSIAFVRGTLPGGR